MLSISLGTMMVLHTLLDFELLIHVLLVCCYHGDLMSRNHCWPACQLHQKRRSDMNVIR